PPPHPRRMGARRAAGGRRARPQPDRAGADERPQERHGIDRRGREDRASPRPQLPRDPRLRRGDFRRGPRPSLHPLLLDQAERPRPGADAGAGDPLRPRLRVQPRPRRGGRGGVQGGVLRSRESKEPFYDCRDSSCSVILIRNRSASFTASESGKTLATSGAREMETSPGLLRPGPRATTRSAWKSYSGLRSSSRSALDFFISSPLTACCWTSADQANPSGPLSISDDEKAPLPGLSHDEVALLID